MLRPNITGVRLGCKTKPTLFKFCCPSPLWAVDLTAAKQFAITERSHADLRGEFYNLLNHANFNIPGATLGAADFGVVSSARAARTVQVGLRVSF